MIKSTDSTIVLTAGQRWINNKGTNMSDMNTWLNRANENGLLTVGERQNLRELIHVLNPTSQEAIYQLCNAAYELGQFTESDIKLEPVSLSDETKKWLDVQTAEERLELIKDMCVDWDGYRAAPNLGKLINEIWAYAARPLKGDAHVLKEGQLHLAYHSGEPVWFESREWPGGPWLGREGFWIFVTDINGTFLYYTTSFIYGSSNLNLSDYNKVWRCWNKKPSSVEMEGAAWND